MKPKIIFFESLDKIRILNDHMQIKKIDTYTTRSRKVDEYLINGRHRLLNFDHLSAGPPASLERRQISDVVRGIINEN